MVSPQEGLGDGRSVVPWLLSMRLKKHDLLGTHYSELRDSVYLGGLSFYIVVSSQDMHARHLCNRIEESFQLSSALDQVAKRRAQKHAW